MELNSGDILRLYVRVGGIGSGGFSIGIMHEQEWRGSFSVEQSGILFAVTEDDFWYVDGMTIDYDKDMDMVVYHQPKFDDLHHPLQT